MARGADQKRALRPEVMETNLPTSRRPAILALGKRKIPRAKEFSPLDKNIFLCAKGIFPCAKEFSPFDKSIFLCVKNIFPCAKEFSSLDKNIFPCAKIIFPRAKNFFASSKRGVFNAKSAISRPESTF